MGILAHDHRRLFSNVGLRKRVIIKDEVVTLSSKLREGSEVLGEWSSQEGQKSSTWREAEAVTRIVKSHVNSLKNSVVKVYSDNKNIKSVLLNGSRKSDIHAVATDLNAVCEKEGIILSPEWIPRESNEKADYLSRCQDSDDWEISSQIFHYLDSVWGPYTIDRFASHLSKKCKRFNSRWWVPGTEAVDAFLQSWKYDSNWLVPPPRLICRCFEKIVAEKANCTLIIPLWKSAPYWACLVKGDGSFNSFIKQVFNLSRYNVVISGKDKHGIFAKNPLPFDMLALNIMYK